jgi:hypothetical protein
MTDNKLLEEEEGEIDQPSDPTKYDVSEKFICCKTKVDNNHNVKRKLFVDDIKECRTLFIDKNHIDEKVSTPRKKDSPKV